MPKQDLVRRWAEEAADGFQFALKFPKLITHEQQLMQAEDETAEFLKLIEILKEANRLGPAFVQLPPSSSDEQLPALESYLRKLPTDFRFAVEVRHPDYFDKGAVERSLDSLLAGLNVDRVLFDSRPFFEAAPTDEYERTAQSRKPQVPVRQTVTSCYPMLRLIGRNDLKTIISWVDQWSTVVAGWILGGLTPYVFAHAPNNELAPTLLNCSTQN